MVDSVPSRSVLQAVLLKSMSISNIHFPLPVESKNTRRDKEDGMGGLSGGQHFLKL